MGHPCHWHGLIPLGTAGEGDAKHPGGRLCILVEHLIEIPQPEEQEAVLMPLFEGLVLLHHGCGFGHGTNP